MRIKLDLKDRKLLYELDLNSRQSYNELARKLWISKNSVIYRINNLVKDGVIKKFHTVYDAGKLGYISFRLYLRLQNATPEKEQEIIDFLVKQEIVTWVVSIEGDYNIGVLILAKTIDEMNVLWNELLEKYLNYLDERLLTIMTGVAYYSRAYLLGLKSNYHEIRFITILHAADLDALDSRMMALLSSNARIPIINLASKLKVSSKTIISRLKNLEKKKVILGYKTVLDYERLGYQYIKLSFRLSNATKEKISQFKSYVKIHPNIIYEDEVLGGDDFEIELQVKDYQEMQIILGDIRKRFANIIKDYKVLRFTKEHKYIFLPVMQ